MTRSDVTGGGWIPSQSQGFAAGASPDDEAVPAVAGLGFEEGEAALQVGAGAVGGGGGEVVADDGRGAGVEGKDEGLEVGEIGEFRGGERRFVEQVEVVGMDDG